MDVLNQVYKVALPQDDDKSILNSVLDYTDNMLDAYTAVLEEDYDAVVMNIIPIAEALLESSYKSKKEQKWIEEGANFRISFKNKPGRYLSTVRKDSVILLTAEATIEEADLFKFLTTDDLRKPSSNPNANESYYLESKRYEGYVCSYLPKEKSRIILTDLDSSLAQDNKIQLVDRGNEIFSIKPSAEDLVFDFSKNLAEIRNYDRSQQVELIPAYPNDLEKEKEDKTRKIHEIFKHSAFLAAVVSSKNSEEIKNAIRAIALPTGSYSIKRKSFFNISLNAYPGLTAGAELILDDSSNENWAFNFGFTAPIGVGINWGINQRSIQLNSIVPHHDTNLTEKES